MGSSGVLEYRLAGELVSSGLSVSAGPYSPREGPSYFPEQSGIWDQQAGPSTAAFVLASPAWCCHPKGVALTCHGCLSDVEGIYSMVWIPVSAMGILGLDWLAAALQDR